MRKVLAVAVALAVLTTFMTISSPLYAQLDVLKKAREATQPTQPAEAKPAAKEDPAGPKYAGAGGATFSAPMTFKNKARNFSFTIPAGWEKMPAGDVNSERAEFGKPGTRCNFNFQYTRMPPSFPRAASVDASLKSAKEDVTINKLLSAKRRDATGMDKGKKVQYAMGWEVVQSPTGGGGSHQRIIWQCYDRENYYFNFMVSCSPQEFNANRAMLQQIIDSVKFGD